MSFLVVFKGHHNDEIVFYVVYWSLKIYSKS